MGYTCPRCGGPVQRSYSGTAQAAAGLVGALIYAAFGSFSCAKCGSIPRREFPPEARTKMAMMSVLMVAGAFLLLIGVLALIVALKI